MKALVLFFAFAAVALANVPRDLYPERKQEQGSANGIAPSPGALAVKGKGEIAFRVTVDLRAR